MQRKLTITVDDEVYRGLHEKVGRGRISEFIADLVRPHVVGDSKLEAAYHKADKAIHDIVELLAAA